MFVVPTIPETAGLEDENGNPIPEAPPEPEKVTLDDLPVGSVWELDGKRRVVVGEAEDCKVLVPHPQTGTMGAFAPASFTGWTRTDPGGQVEQMKAELEKLRETAMALSLSARFANLARACRGLSENFDVLSACAVGVVASDPWDTLTDARGLLGRLSAGHGMLEELVFELGAKLGPDDFSPVHQAIAAALVVEGMEEAALFAAVSEAVGRPVDQRTFTRALLGLISIQWVNPPAADGAVTLTDKARAHLEK